MYAMAMLLDDLMVAHHPAPGVMGEDFDDWFKTAILPVSSISDSIREPNMHYTKEALEWTWKAAIAKNTPPLVKKMEAQAENGKHHAGGVCHYYKRPR